MSYVIKRLRKWLICRKYHICPTHGELMRDVGGYGPHWMCDTCIRENEAKTIHRSKRDELARIDAQKRLNKDWAIPEGRDAWRS